MLLTDAHAQQIAHLLNTCNELTIPYNAQMILAESANYLVRLDDQNNVTAFIEAKKVQWYQTEIRHLTAAPSHERRGLARGLLREAETHARSKGQRLLQCTIRQTNQRSMSLFESEQFFPTTRFYNSNGGNFVVVLQKVLSVGPTEIRFPLS